MSKYRKLILPIVGILYVILKQFGVTIPIAEVEAVDIVMSLGVALGVWGLKNGE